MLLIGQCNAKQLVEVVAHRHGRDQTGQSGEVLVVGQSRRQHGEQRGSGMTGKEVIANGHQMERSRNFRADVTEAVVERVVVEDSDVFFFNYSGHLRCHASLVS